MKHRTALAALVAVLALAGCGGPASTLLPVPRNSVTELDADQGAAAAWLNAYRKARGLPSVVVDAGLRGVAQRQADAMASAGVLSHTVDGPLPRRLAGLDRAERAQAENVSAGYRDLAAALSGWQRSPAHNANLLYAPMRRIGVAGASAPGTRYKTFWALVMTD